MVAPKYTRQTQFGVLDLAEEKTLQTSHKIPSLTWITCQEEDRGLAFITQGVPINEIKGGEVYCTLLRSVSVLSADGVSGPLVPTPEAQELGEHIFAYSVLPYSGDWRQTQVHRRAYETSQPLAAFQTNKEPLRNTHCDFSLEPDNLIISTVKRAEDDDSLILRLFETIGRACRARLRLPAGIKRAYITNLLEQPEREIAFKNGKLELDVSPFEIVTLKLEFEQP
jgi:alpha-mannosidase